MHDRSHFYIDEKTGLCGAIFCENMISLAVPTKKLDVFITSAHTFVS